MPDSAIQLHVPVSTNDHIQGSITAPIVLVQYGDYQCAYTRRANRSVKALQTMLGSRLCFVFRNFPLDALHPHALQAAEAAEAAAAQGKFWPMHACLFDHQRALDHASLLLYATMLGLDHVRFQRDLAERTALPRIAADVMSGDQSSVEGTPTFFINGLRHDGPYELAALQQGIRQAVAQLQLQR